MTTLFSSRQRGRNARSEQSREKIISVTRSLVTEKGHTPAFMEISVRAKISVPDVFEHFKTLEELYTAALSDLIDTIEAECAECYNPLRSLEHLFDRLWDQNGEMMITLASQGNAAVHVGARLTKLFESCLKDLHDHNLVAEHVNLKALAQHHANAVVGSAVLESPNLTPASAFRFLLDSLGTDM
jgi:AcrR family transcriptional regulator